MSEHCLRDDGDSSDVRDDQLVPDEAIKEAMEDIDTEEIVAELEDEWEDEREGGDADTEDEGEYVLVSDRDGGYGRFPVEKMTVEIDRSTPSKFYGGVDTSGMVESSTHECSVCGEERDLGDYDRQYADCPNCGKRRFFDPIDEEEE